MAKTDEMSAADESALLEFLPGAEEFLRGPTGTAGGGNDPGHDGAGDEPEDDQDEEQNPDGEADPKDDEDPKEKDDEPVGSKGMQKRIDKLTAKAKSAEERASELEAKLKDAETKAAERGERPEPVVVAAPSAADPLSDVQNEDELQARVAQAIAVKRWCITNPDGGVVTNDKGEEVEISAEAARKMMADVEERLTLHVPRRAKYLAEESANAALAREFYPDLYKGDNAKMREQLLKAWPEVMRFPDWQLVLGDYMTGHKLRTEKAAAAKLPVKKTAKLAPPVPKAGAAKPASNQTRAKANGSAAGHVAERNGSIDALTDYFAAA
jgi:ubiquitin